MPAEHDPTEYGSAAWIAAQHPLVRRTFCGDFVSDAELDALPPRERAVVDAGLAEVRRRGNGDNGMAWMLFEDEDEEKQS